jgi:pimeloyl-ACP methyl ester carboxylesterase
MTDQIGLQNLKWKTVDGLKIRYATDGRDDGEPILLLSPWPESIFAFLPTWQEFAELGRVVAVDLPAFGHSESRQGLRTPESMGEFVLLILEAFGLREPHVVAPDVGTPAVLFAAANHPGLFKSLIIGSGATDHTDIGGILDELVNAESLEPYKGMTGEQFVRGATADMKKYQIPPYVLNDYISSYRDERFFESVEFVRDYPRSLPALAKRLKDVKAPCQITVGRHDPFVPVSNAVGLHNGLPKSAMNVLECGHFAWEDGAAEYGAIAANWIRGGYATV